VPRGCLKARKAFKARSASLGCGLMIWVMVSRVEDTRNTRKRKGET
jgi:hypothetical protein